MAALSVLGLRRSGLSRRDRASGGPVRGRGASTRSGGGLALLPYRLFRVKTRTSPGGRAEEGHSPRGDLVIEIRNPTELYGDKPSGDHLTLERVS
jgi:hypothetical protein